MSRDENREDHSILQALETLHQQGQEGLEGQQEALGSGDALAREYIELLSLLPHALEPVDPPPALRQEILQAAVREDPASGQVVPLRPPPFHTAPKKPRALGRWIPALAAGLALCLTGIVLLLVMEMRGQQRTIDALVVKLEGRLDQQIEVERLHNQLMEFQQRFDMITTVAAGLYPLHPPQAATTTAVAAAAASMMDPTAPRGVMYVCSNHQQWYLHLQNLKPSREGQNYVLWFLTDKGPVEMDTFRIEDYGQTMQFRRTSMPAGTHGVMLSLQSLEQPPERPTGAVVLQGERSIRL